MEWFAPGTDRQSKAAILRFLEKDCHQYWSTFGRAIDACFARKTICSMATLGEIILHICMIKPSVAQSILIDKSATHWEQCMLHGLGMLSVGTSEPSSYVFSLVTHATASYLPRKKKKTTAKWKLFCIGCVGMTKFI